MFSNFIKIPTNRSIVQPCKSSLFCVQKRSVKIIPRERKNLPSAHKSYSEIIRQEEGPRGLFKLKKDPREKFVLLLGGEDSHHIGMCESALDHPEISKRFEQAEKVFGWNIADICINGPKKELVKVKHLSPCVFMSNFVALFYAKQKMPAIEQHLVSMTSAGIGELNALVFNGSMRFEDALEFLKIRTDALSFLAERSKTRSVMIYEGAATKPKFMCEAAKEWCLRKGISKQDAFCEITHWLHPETKIIGGHHEAIDFIFKNEQNFALKKTYALNWDIAYYSSYLRPISEILRAVADRYTLRAPSIMIHSTSGEVYTEKKFFNILTRQVSSPVRLERNLTFIYGRDKKSFYPNTIECAAVRSISLNLRKQNMQGYKGCHTFFS